MAEIRPENRDSHSNDPECGRASIGSPSDLLSVLRSRAADLRLMATSIRTPLSNAYRRRAAELELQAAALAAGLGFQERPICVATVAA